MLSKPLRLKNTKDIGLVLKKGVGQKTTNIIIKTTPNNLPQGRFGFIVSKSVSKKAVVRNKVKRRLRAIIENHKELNSIKNDVLVIALPRSGGATYKQLELDLLSCFDKINHGK